MNGNALGLGNANVMIKFYNFQIPVMINMSEMIIRKVRVNLYLYGIGF